MMRHSLIKTKYHCVLKWFILFIYQFIIWKMYICSEISQADGGKTVPDKTVPETSVVQTNYELE